MSKPSPRPSSTRRGASPAEYGLVAVLAAVAVLGTLSTFGGQLRVEFARLAGSGPVETGQPGPPG